VEPSFLTKRIPEPSRTSLPQKAHRFGTYISDYRTPSFCGLQDSEYKGLVETGLEKASKRGGLTFPTLEKAFIILLLTMTPAD
jgi:hypothetical protein